MDTKEDNSGEKGLLKVSITRSLAPINRSNCKYSVDKFKEIYPFRTVLLLFSKLKPYCLN